MIGVVDFTSKEFLANPYPYYQQMREEKSPLWFPHGGLNGGMWLFTGYQDVAQILKDAQTTKDASRFTQIEQNTSFDQNMLLKDPPDHTRLRSLAIQAFTPARVRDLEPRIIQIVDELIARVKPEGHMEFMSDFALPLPVIVIAELLGVPPDERDVFHAWSNQIATGFDAARSSEPIREQAQAATLSLIQYFIKLINTRRDQPKNDLISAMIVARDAEDKLTEEELVAMCMLLLIAGHETTVHLFGNGLMALLQHPEQLRLLKKRPELMPSAVEEMLRFDSPVQRSSFRITTETHMIGNTMIEKGQQISAVIGAANRDPDQFSEPDTFDITRHPNRHLAFGLGIHFCLGAPLARTEARIGFTRLLDQFPNIRLANKKPDWSKNTFFRGLTSLPIVF